MQPVISAEQAKQIDRLTSEKYQKPSFELMQSAAEACFHAIKDHFSGDLSHKKALMLCGPGNNGGDGAALALGLAAAEVKTDVVLFGSLANAKGDAQTNLETVHRLSGADSRAADSRSEFLSFVECENAAGCEELAPKFSSYDVIVDGLFGVGLNRPLAGTFAQIIKHLNTTRSEREHSAGQQPLIVSIDLPSGLDSDCANVIGETVAADLTVTFTAPKLANVLPPASHLNGRLVVADIGSPAALIETARPNAFLVEEDDARRWLFNTRYTRDSFKNTHGHVLVIAGSRGYSGAAVLCGEAAMRSGAGLVTIATPASAQAAIAAGVMPEVMTTALAETDRGAVSDEAVDHTLRLAAKASVIAIGPGLSSEDERTRRFVHSVVKQRTTAVVIDADGLNCLAPWPKDLRGSDSLPLVLTPHLGEMKRLLGTDEGGALDDRVGVARECASKNNLILLLKGSRSIIAAPDGRVFINPTGNPGYGTAGAGDTLTGLIAGFIAQAGGKDPLSATIAALYIGGLAADLVARKIGMRTMVASDIREHFSEAIRTLDPRGELPEQNG